ncbi:hypothetical protein pb186bvf_012503 [Paramecium bursaria]
MSQVKQPLDPKDKVLNISRKKTSSQFIFLAKIFLKKFGEIELHGLGDATKTVAQVAESLVRKEYATYVKIETQTFQPEGEENKGRKKVKLIAKLTISDKGLQLIEEDLLRKHPQQ